MALENKWVTYLDRSFKNIKASLLTRLSNTTPEITDHSDSNILILIIDAVAGLFEQLNYYIDSLARESYIVTARRYSSMIKLTRLIDYRVKSKIGSTVDLKISAKDSSGDLVNLVSDHTLASGLIVKDSSGIEFIIEKKTTIFAGSSFVVTGARQRKKVTDEILGTTTSSTNQYYELNTDYQDNTLQIEIDSQTWSLVDTFSFSGPNDKHFIVEVDQNKQAWVFFGDGINGAIPNNGQSILATYYTTKGLSSNVSANTITEWDSEPTPPIQTPTIDEFSVTNELQAVGGQDEEDIEAIRKHAPLSLRTLERAVTLQDHVDLCLLVPGVGKAKPYFDINTKTINFYIAPEEGGTASSQLLTDVEDFFTDKKMLTTTISANAAGETKLRLTINATVKFRRNTTQAESDIISALETEFGFNNSDVNRVIRKSDIIALIDNLDKIDYLSLDIITTKPYPRITYGTSQLEGNWLINVKSTNTSIYKWRLVVISSTVANLYRINSLSEESFISQIAIGSSDPGIYTYSGTYIELSIWGTFNTEDEWEFYSYPYNQDIVFSDNTIPIFDSTELSLTVNEQVGV